MRAAGFHQGEVFVRNITQFFRVDFTGEDFLANFGDGDDVAPGSEEGAASVVIDLVDTEDVAAILVRPGPHHGGVDGVRVRRKPDGGCRVEDQLCPFESELASGLRVVTVEADHDADFYTLDGCNAEGVAVPIGVCLSDFLTEMGLLIMELDIAVSIEEERGVGDA